MNILFIILFSILTAHSSTIADYKVKKGQLHRGGDIVVQILPDKEVFNVKMVYKVKKKEMVPVPDKLLRGESIMQFPEEFRTEKGYQNLEKQKIMTIPKARLEFVGRKDFDDKKGGYLFKIFPHNKKTRIEVLYHPDLPAVGWKNVDITFLSDIPLLNGYEIQAHLK